MAKSKIRVSGMVCQGCEGSIEDAVKKLKGVGKARADYKSSSISIEYDRKKTCEKKIINAIRNAGYDVSFQGQRLIIKSSELKRAALSILMIAAAAAAYMKMAPLFEAHMPSFGQDASLGLLFILGFFTGFHCIAMCGGFVIGYSSKEPGIWPHIVYGGSKTISYAIIGAIFGFFGSFIAFTPNLRAAAAVLAGVFLIIFGLNMLNLISWAKYMRVGTPSLVNRILKRHGKSPAIIGLLNGLLLACGPLQAVYLMAAATGSPATGASYLFAFGLGTLPVLLGFGFFTQAVSKRHSAAIVRYSGAIVVILGLVMINRAMALAGTGYDMNTLMRSATAQDMAGENPLISDGYQTIRMQVDRRGWSPNTFTLKKGVPVRWEIEGKQITGCNNAIHVPAFGLEFDIKEGLQTIEFTPDKEGVIPFSCWMGMIPGTFIVKDDIGQAEKETIAGQLKDASETETGPGYIQETTIPISGMCCDSCALEIATILNGIDGVKSSIVGLASGTAVIEYDPERANRQEFANAIRNTGYIVQEAG